MIVLQEFTEKGGRKQRWMPGETYTGERSKEFKERGLIGDKEKVEKEAKKEKVEGKPEKPKRVGSISLTTKS